jgi:hypothetical protein
MHCDEDAEQLKRNGLIESNQRRSMRGRIPDFGRNLCAT